MKIRKRSQLKIARTNPVSYTHLDVYKRQGLNITQKAVSRMETGKRVIADYELPYLADVLDVTIYYLLGMEEIQRADNYIS